MSKKIIEIKVPADLNLSSMVRTMASDVFRMMRFSAAWCDRLKLVVDELYMNAVHYGSAPGVSDVHIRFLIEENQVEFQISDEGTGPVKTTPEALEQRITEKGEQPSITQTFGRGLAMITHLWTDELKVSQSEWGGITLAFVKKVETSPPPSPPLPPSPPVSTAFPLPVGQSQGPIVSFALRGEMDSMTMENIAAAVEKQIHTLAPGSVLVFDFKEVDYINSTFIGYLASWYNAIAQKGGAIKLKNTNAQIQDVIHLVGLSRVIPLE